MKRKNTILLRMFNVQKLLDEQLLEDLDRLNQLDKLISWYEGFNPLPHLVELAEHQVTQRVEAAALKHFNDQEFEGFRLHWRKLTLEEQRSFLNEIAGFPTPAIN
jgi:hypothetical protein